MSNESDIEIKQSSKISENQEPSKYGIYLLNNDYISFEVVILVLSHEFNIESAQAFKIAKQVHDEGRGLLGTFSKDMAETKANRANVALGIISKSIQSDEYSDCITDIFIADNIN